MVGHLRDLQHKLSFLVIFELADAVGGFVELSGDVGDLWRRVLLVSGEPALGLLRRPGLVWVMRMIVLRVPLSRSMHRRLVVLVAPVLVSVMLLRLLWF